MSHLSRREYFYNLRKSYHVLAVGETHIFLGEDGKEASGQAFSELCKIKNCVQADLQKIDSLLDSLEQKLEEYKFGLPTLLIEAEKKIYEGTRHEIDLMIGQMKNQLDLVKGYTSENGIDEQFKLNLCAHFAHRLTEQFEKYQVFQKMFNKILFERRIKAGEKEKTAAINTTTTESSPSSQPSPPPSSSALLEVVLDESREQMLQERSEEIEQVITDSVYVHDVLNQIQVMAVEQGSLFDRIDVNLDKTRGNLTKAIGKLEQTADAFSAHQKRLILMFITVAIFLVSVAIFMK